MMSNSYLRWKVDSYNMFSIFNVSEKDNQRVLNFVLGG